MPDASTTSQSTLLLQKKKEMMDVQQQLDRKKEECRKRMQRCQIKEVELATRQEQLKERVAKFDKFLRDTDTKRTRAVRREQDEIKVADQKMLEIRQLQETFVKSTEERDHVEATLERNQAYEQFLLHVCDSTEYFSEISDILMRHDTLVAANADLLQRITQAQAEAEEMRARLSLYVKEAQTESLVHNSEIAAQQQALEEFKRRVSQMELELSRNEGGAKERSRELGEINMAIQNIYVRCEKTKMRVPTVDPPTQPERLGAAEVMPLLDTIETRVTDLLAILKALKEHRRQAAANAAANAAAPGVLPPGTTGILREPGAGANERAMGAGAGVGVSLNTSGQSGGGERLQRSQRGGDTSGGGGTALSRRVSLSASRGATRLIPSDALETSRSNASVLSRSNESQRAT